MAIEELKKLEALDYSKQLAFTYLTLLTRNVSDFKKIPQLNIINPWESPLTINPEE